MSLGKILLAEDDQNLGFVIQDHLEHTGFQVVRCTDGQAAADRLIHEPFDLAIVDVMMPKLDGFELARQIRATNENMPILFLTARSMEQDRLMGFEVGGDDYITKPFSLTELTYRVKVFLRRNPEQTASMKDLKVGQYALDMTNLCLSLGPADAGVTQSLTQMEAKLLEMLIQQKNSLIKRETILEAIWGENDYFKGRSLDVFISRLRKYLRHDPQLAIRNHHGVGFTLIDQ